MTVEASGPEDALPIVFLHGAGVNRKMWMSQAAALEREFRVITLDLPGHGPLADRRFRMDDAVAEVAGVRLERPAVVVGLSLGAHVAMSFAGRYPERVAGLVVSGGSGDHTGWVGLRMRANAALLSLVFRIVGDRNVRRAAARSFTRQAGREVAAAVLAVGVRPQAGPEILRELAGVDYTPALRAYGGPTLILNGAGDRANRRAERRLLAAAPHAAVRVLAGAGHTANWDRAPDFTEVLRDFALSVKMTGQMTEQPPPTP
ncbi:alpha/beta hydrolase [Allokutzneria sp. A3M-2-11 16]|uniref:alpha/beta fold hydrolase n=1 Tax=Allokutzneria sp. A3M-2-11 16 TaxID=2962043 RepID=UPI0020B64436|nr:alpha/beta hydrolase [Allokutzneria sp. A3M-2-11 16]MCP3800139.1 alpha/beta hydrolase [Allokutzneria sp. A3M-2-11 16]